MTSNPFDKHRETTSGGSGGNGVGLVEWCDEQNHKPISARMARWYFVAEKDGAQVIDTLTGTDADCLRKMLAGKLDDFAGWSEPRMTGYRRWLWSCARRGLLEEPKIAPSHAHEREAAE